ncbi:MAG: DsbA family protein [Thaumarchaeota archaeon]|nr:DsbA family protein [Nitrososphaerota archaeon]
MRNRRPKKGYHAKTIAAGLGVAAVVIIITFFALSSGGNNGSGADSRLAYLKVLPAYPVLGRVNASVTIFQFGDFQCPTCDYWFKTQENQVVQNLVDTGKAKLVWRDFVIYGADSVSAAEAAYSAGEQGKFWEYHDLLYSNQKASYSGWASPNNLVKFAQGLGLNMAQFNQSFYGGKFASLVNSNIADAKSVGVSGTPTFFVVGQNGKIVVIEGAQPYSVFQQAVNSVSG